MTNLKSLCSVRVGSPVVGPGRCISTTTSGISAMPESPSASTIKEKPPPEVPVMAQGPANEAPIAILMAAISSSACSTTRPASSLLDARYSMMEVEGDMGYAE